MPKLFTSSLRSMVQMKGRGGLATALFHFRIHGWNCAADSKTSGSADPSSIRCIGIRRIVAGFLGVRGFARDHIVCRSIAALMRSLLHSLGYAMRNASYSNFSGAFQPSFCGGERHGAKLRGA
jgi:hypothetical protein